MKIKKNVFALLISVPALMSLTACDLTQFFNKSKKDDSQPIDGVVFTFETDRASDFRSYFRSTSFGDFDFNKKTFKEPDFYDASMISDGSVNPLCYTSYKLKKLEEAGQLPNGFKFLDYDITYSNVLDYYPTPDCQLANDINTIVNSDAHYIKEPVDNKYSCSAVYCPAYNYVIDVLNAIPLSGAVARDERAYYKYALDHYTAIPEVYMNVIDDIINENNWYNGEYDQVNEIAAYISSVGAPRIVDEGNVDIQTSANGKLRDPINELIENHTGNDFDFSTLAVMTFRRLNIPARMVEGYLLTSVKEGVNEVDQTRKHYWSEIYVSGTGWMICDCTDIDSIIGENPYAN